MSLELPSGIRVTNNVDADSWAGPYASLSAARAAVPVSMRLYRTVKVIESGNINEYVWRSGTADGDLERKALVKSESDAAYELLANKATSLVSNDNTHYPTTAAVKTADDTNLALAYAYTDSVVVGSFSYRGTHDGSSGNYPTTGGRGGSGVPIKGDAYEILAACTIQGVDYDQGDLIVAKVNTPAQTNSNWATSEHNTQQATTSMRGTAMIVDSTTIQNNATTDDQKIVTASKYWLGLGVFAGQVNTWANVQTFTSAPKFNSASASQYLKTDGSKNLTSVSTLPDSDFTYSNQAANLIWAGPATGAAAAPTFRALVTADLAASLVTYAKIQNVANGCILGNATGGAAAPSEISVENGATLSASKIKWGGALTASTTITHNGIGWLNFTGTWTANANSQISRTFTDVLTFRNTAADTLTATYFNPSFVLASTTQNPIGLNLDVTYVQQGGVSTTIASTSTVAGMTATTYNNVAPASTSGIGSGALFTVIVGSATTITSITITATAGSNYKVNDTITFNGSQFGSGSGTAIFIIRTIAGMSLGTTATPLRINVSGANSNDFPKLIDFYYEGSTASGSIRTAGAGLRWYDASGGEIFRSTNSAMVISASTLLISGTATFAAAPTFQLPITSNYPNAINSTPTSSFTATGAVGGIIINNAFQSKYRTAVTSVDVGHVTAITLTSGGTGYTTGTKTTTGGAGTGCSIAVGSVSGGVITSVSVAISTASGVNYNVGDVLTLSGGTGGTVTVTAVDLAGTIMMFEDANSIVDAHSNNKYFSFIARPTYNITSTQAGTIGGFYYNPTLTSVGSFNNYGIVIVPASCLNGFGVANPTAIIEIGAQTSSRAALKFNSGTIVSSVVGGNAEYNNSFYLTKNSGLRFGVGGTIFEKFTDSGNISTGETDIYTYTTPANTFEANGAKIKATYGYNLVNSTSTKQIKLYFAGSVIFDSGALTVTAAANLTVEVTIIRVSATVVRYMIKGIGKNTSTVSFSEVGELTSLTLSNTNILKTTGQAAGVGAASNDIVGNLADAYWLPVSNN